MLTAYQQNLKKFLELPKMTCDNPDCKNPDVVLKFPIIRGGIQMNLCGGCYNEMQGWDKKLRNKVKGYSYMTVMQELRDAKHRSE